ncbi:MAG: acyl-CoA thioesterase [Bacteroidales bacterium]|nr:acyl-CoA thioesterase [Bacteroidales bacterium]
MNKITPFDTLEMEVRDYEVDLQGIVNNANYMHYLEHARHKYLLSLDVDFEELHKRGTDLIVVRAELDYRLPLKSGDRFVIKTTLSVKGNIRVLFDQHLFRLPGMEKVLDAKITGAALKDGRPCMPGEILKVLTLLKEAQ